MSSPQQIPGPNKVPVSPSGDASSPIGSPGTHFLIPSPIPTRRTRTYSQSERALQGPSYLGKVKSFCREKGHGFINPNDGGDPIFMHISDIDGDFVPKAGDDVKFKMCPIPPKKEKFSAVHVTIVHPAQGVKHERWDAPVDHSHKSS